MNRAAGAPATRLGAYTLEQGVVLGEGATSVVYAARDEAGAPVALKVLRARVDEDPRGARRLEREARALRALAHPAAVRVRDAGTLPDGRAYLAMERLAGEALSEALARRGEPYPLDAAWALLAPVCEALAHAHALGVRHRDVKPANIVLRSEGRAVLVDWGLAAPPSRHAKGAAPSALTHEGEALGTPAYMAPEQWWGAAVGPEADQYALACTLYELATGAPPFGHGAFAALLARHLHEPAPTFAARGLRASAAQEAWLARALAKEPGARFASMRALGDEAARVFAGARERSAVRGRDAGAAILALGALAGVLALGYGVGRSPLVALRLAGAVAWPVVPLFAVGLVALALRRPALARAVALLLPPFSLLGEALGLEATRAYLRAQPDVARFAVLSLGVTEAGASRFLGAGAAAALWLGALAARDDDALATPAVSPRARTAALACGAFALVGAALARGPAGVLGAFGALLVAHALLERRALAAELRAGLERFVALALVAAGVAAQLRARPGLAWLDAHPRVERAALFLAAAREARLAHAVLGAAALALALAWAYALRRAPGTLAPPPRSARARLAAALPVALVALWAAGQYRLALRVASLRAEHYAELAPRFTWFHWLRPPRVAPERARLLGTPALAPTLRLGRDVVLLDAQRVGLTRALARDDAAQARGALALDLSHRYAREPQALERPVQLTLVADGAVAFGAVRAALAVARGLGVERVEWLVARPDEVLEGFGDDAPEEASYVLPSDVLAVPVALVAAGGTPTPPALDDALPVAAALPRVLDGPRRSSGHWLLAP